MSTVATNQTLDRSLPNAVKAGIIGGLGGGLVFGMMMGLMGMLPMVGMLVRVENAIVGFAIHMLISAFIGATFGVIANRLPVGWVSSIVAGAVYGIVWWVLGALILMPLMLGMTDMVFAIGQPQIMSLMGHLIFGVIMGALFVPFNK